MKARGLSTILLALVLGAVEGVGAINNLHFGIKVDWARQARNGNFIPHMTIAYYARLPEANMRLLDSVAAICRAVRESTGGTLKASGTYQPGRNPGGKSCIYAGPVEDVLEAARAALDDLARGKASYDKRMLVPHVDMSYAGRNAFCPPTYEFDFSHVYYQSPTTGQVSLPCRARTPRRENKGPVTTTSGQKGTTEPDAHLIKSKDSRSQRVKSKSRRREERRRRKHGSVEKKKERKKRERKISRRTSIKSGKPDKLHRHQLRDGRWSRADQKSDPSSSSSEIFLQHVKLRRPSSLK